MTAVFISYKRDVEPDGYLLNRLEEWLNTNGYQVLVDHNLDGGVQWAAELDRQICTADVCIALLSQASVQSEMVVYEIEMARDAARKQNGSPRIVPIRVRFDAPLPSELAHILDPIQHLSWQHPSENEALMQAVLQALRSPDSPTGTSQTSDPAWDSGPGVGAVPLDSQFYVVRPTDQELYTALVRHDSLVLLKGARQMGKTSLLARGLQHARENGFKVILTDFQKLNTTQLTSVETLYQALGGMIADQLDLDAFPEDIWSSRRGPNANFERFLRREVLDKFSEPVLWGMDEVDRLFAGDFYNEVFGLFRAWHNERTLDPSAPWQQLTLAIAYATEAHLFITDPNQSPFNVGTRLHLADFSLEQVADLNQRYESPLRTEQDVQEFFQLVGGQPYLVRHGLQEMQARSLDLATLNTQATTEEGLYGDHLRRMLVLLVRDQALCDQLREVLSNRPLVDPSIFYRLRSAGILAGESAREARLRCQLYATYLKRHLL